MFASAVLPFQITIVVSVISLIFFNLAVRRKKFALQSIYVVSLLFIPSCIGITFLVDTVRYGKFEYADVSELKDDSYIKLPNCAMQIVLHRNAGGHVARFFVTTPELIAWIEKMRSNRPDLNRRDHENEWQTKLTGPALIETQELNSKLFANRFSAAEWKYDPKMYEFQVMLSDRGGGFSVFHVPGSSVAYLSALYW